MEYESSKSHSQELPITVPLSKSIQLLWYISSNFCIDIIKIELKEFKRIRRFLQKRSTVIVLINTQFVLKYS